MTLLWVALVAGVMGSLHCAGMCGPLALLVAGNAERRGATLAWQAGRLASYALLGGAAGAAGSALDASFSWFGFQRAALIASGLLLIAVGLLALAHRRGWLAWIVVPSGLRRGLVAVQRRAVALPPLRRAWMLGLSTPLLPCGWLYAWAAAAAGTGSPGQGALLLVAFGAGSLPALTVLSEGLRRATGRLGRSLPLAGELTLIASGCLLLVARLDVPAPAADRTPTTVMTATPPSPSGVCCDARD